ncbi:MAG: DUF5683 domain-containing protein [Candidatus Kapabacteria bacterium]|nr:DUF5683 domain-containing protein [Candidatus Kapabacteria bacterium]MDW8012237.1 DUF5683 domain-containing protein [Bacteroidota bacterium]
MWIVPWLTFALLGVATGSAAGACDSSHASELAAQADSLSPAKSSATVKTPMGALWRSLVVPGWGQLYIGAYWKAPVFFLVNVLSTYATLSNHRLYVRYQRQVEDVLAGRRPAEDLAALRAYRTLYADRRDIALAIWVAAYLLAAVDAYVGANLMGFDVSDRLSVAPLSQPGVVAVVLSLRWR